MISRHVFEGTAFKDYTLTYDAENRLVSVSGDATASFVYDGDGKPLGRACRDQIKATVNGITAVYVGNHYEVKNSVVTKYYFAGVTRLAVRTDGTLRFLLGDHIGSSSVTTNASGAKTASALYREASCKDKAFGETRFTSGTLSTDYKFTGQREESALGIYWFSSRWFDPTLGRFMSPDTIVPTSTQGTQAWDRYAFVNNNPVRYTDPTGHSAECDLNPCDEEEPESQPPPLCLPNDTQCLLEDIQSKYGIIVNNADGLWSPDQLVAIGLGMQKLMAAMGNEAFQGLFSGVVFSIGGCSAKRMCTTGNRDVIIDTRVGNDMAYIQRETVHELAHVWSAITGTRMSKSFMTATGGYYQSGVYVPGSTPPTTHASLGRGEDWAESVTAFLYPGYGTLDPTRASFVGGALSNPFLYFFNYMGMGR